MIKNIDSINTVAEDFSGEEGNKGYEGLKNLYDEDTIEKLKYHYKEILKLLGENPEREGLLKTPERISRAMLFCTYGYHTEPKQILTSAMFQEDYQQMVIVKDIEIYSICEHHMLPLIGKDHVGYIPRNHIVGLSKIARVVDAYARRLQVQERLTTEIKNVIAETLDPLGVGVVIEAQHTCMSMRGIQKQNSVTTTSDFMGAFLRKETREEFMHLIGTKLH